MHYTFPIINTIDDVLPHIEGADDFIVVDKGDYKVVNYVVISNSTFPPVNDLGSAIRRECRGLIFSSDGKLINRRFHKFFNFGEREECLPDNVDLSKPHHILEKLDGSMISPCMIGNRVMWISKMGITDTGAQAGDFVKNKNAYYGFARYMFENKCTGIFEWCSNKNRIVLDYPEDNLVLTAIRHNETGEYFNRDQMIDTAHLYGIPVVKSFAYDVSNIRQIVREQEGAEGVVIRFDDGHMLKIKSDWYIKIHRVKSLLDRERDVVNIIVSKQIDDIISVLPEADQAKIREFSDRLIATIKMSAFSLYYIITDMKNLHLTKKDYALSDAAKKAKPIIKSFVFKYYDVATPTISEFIEIITEWILLHTTSNSTFAKAKETFLYKCDYNESKED